MLHKKSFTNVANTLIMLCGDIYGLRLWNDAYYGCIPTTSPKTLPFPEYPKPLKFFDLNSA